jgi:nitroimidazol reductase NimA-like FMN-containing flavoprotein (pyridoxamine 5'-phosphate oxidase superfamily)
MSDHPSDEVPGSPARPEPEGGPAAREPILEHLDEAECLRLMSLGGIGRIAYSGRSGVTVLPVNYKLHEGAVVFRTAQDGPLDEDLRTGIASAEYKVAFEIDDFDLVAREGWSILIQGAAHHVDTEEERASVLEAGVEPWPGGKREHFLRIIPLRISGRRIRQIKKPAAE